jgi:hypothetical protein
METIRGAPVWPPPLLLNNGFSDQMEEVRITFKDRLANELHRLALDSKPPGLNWAEEESHLADQCGGLYSLKAEDHREAAGAHHREAAAITAGAAGAEDHREAAGAHHRAAEITATVEATTATPRTRGQIMVEAKTEAEAPKIIL